MGGTVGKIGFCGCVVTEGKKALGRPGAGQQLGDAFVNAEKREPAGLPVRARGFC
jgi:hypothetical protein